MPKILTTQLPVADWVESGTDWLTNHFSRGFHGLQVGGQAIMDSLTSVLLLVPGLVWIGLLTVAAYNLSRKKSLTLFTFFGLLFIYNQGLWPELMNTVTLVFIASFLSIIIGIPLGILMAKSQKAQSIITPILDFMQTMPGFVYLIPAVAFFGIGMVPGVFASIIFALPPIVRFTNLGIRQVPKELVETSDSFGGTAWQKLIKLELPLAKKTILAGMNQTTMLALSMVVIASMIGAPGLGRGVLSSLQRAQVGNGFVNGLALVILAIIMDRFTQSLNREPSHTPSRFSWKQKLSMSLLVIVVLFGGTFGYRYIAKEEAKGEVNLAYVEWDTEVASTHVVGEILKELGYHVNVTPLDNAIMWQSVAKGESDGMVAAWLPNTHEAQFNKYQHQVDHLGRNLKGAKVGLAVPSYMKVNSIADLKQEANQKIIGIEPGAGVVAAAERTLKAYPNLKDWQLETSSSGAMTVAVDKAIKEKKPIVFTGWSPHWMFAKYGLKYLEDPKQAMGSGEEIHTIARKGLKEELPEVYQVLKKFNWSKDDMESVMLEINQGKEPKQAAKEWISQHPKQVDKWIE